MKRVTPMRVVFAGALMLTLPVMAQAHTGHGSVEGLLAGCAHPVSGWDHLLAMVAVGFWAAMLSGPARGWVPIAFVGAMACGAAAGGTLIAPGLIEPMIFTSVMVAGLLVAGAVRLPALAGSALVATFAVFHGAAHAAEMPAGANGLLYGAGFFVTTAALLLVGMVAGTVTQRSSLRLCRWLGGAVILGGLCFAA